MNTKRIVLSAIIAALPFSAMAENISGAMYIAPIEATRTDPAPTTDAHAPYGRINIDTDDQEHIATTAYVKGAYNSAIAAVNAAVDNLYIDKQDQLYNGNIAITEVQDMDGFIAMANDAARERLLGGGSVSDISSYLQRVAGDKLPASASAIVGMMATAEALKERIDSEIDSKRVDVYTTWGDDTAAATTQVELSTIE